MDHRVAAQLALLRIQAREEHSDNLMPIFSTRPNAFTDCNRAATVLLLSRSFPHGAKLHLLRISNPILLNKIFDILQTVEIHIKNILSMDLTRM